MLGFMAGVVTGGVIGYHWRDQIHRYFDRKLPPVRDQVADGLHQVEQSTSDVLGRLRNGISARLRDGERRLRSGRGDGVIVTGSPDR